MKELLAKLDNYSEELLEFTQALVKVNSANCNETEVARLIKDKLAEHGISSKLYGSDKTRQGLIARIKGRKSNKTIMLNGHLDTVKFGNLKKWKFHPLSGKIVDDKMHGRGVQDMKSSIAAMVFTAIALVKLNIPLDGNILLVFNYDEESGNHSGIKEALKHVKADACIVGEPAGEKNVRIGYRGIYRFKVITKGHTGHTGSLEPIGINAVTKMAKLLLALEKIKPEYMRHKLFPSPRLTPGTVIRGGYAINIFPDQCEALVDCRLSYGQTKQTWLKEINAVLDKLKKADKDFSAKIEQLAYIEPYINKDDEKIVKIAQEVMTQVLGDRPNLGISGGVADANLIHQAGIPAICIGPDGSGAHTENEYIVLDSVKAFSKIYALCAINFLNST